MLHSLILSIMTVTLSYTDLLAITEDMEYGLRQGRAGDIQRR